jgi:membrane-bound inhibitor of C-type lysozyme
MNPTIAARGTAAALLACAACAAAAPLTFPDLPGVEPQTFDYACAGGATLHVSYWSTANGQSFALVPVNGKPLLFVDTIAGSGVRYLANRYVWWTKGPHADLYDTMAGPNAPPIVAGCVEQH